MLYDGGALCPRYVPDAEEDEDVVMSENTCVAWSDDEVVEAVHTLREGDLHA